MDLLTEEQKINLIFQKDSNLVEMSCVIEKIYDDRIEIILPQYFMRYIEYLQVGCKLTAKVFSKLGTVDFNTMVISSPLEDVFAVELDYNALKLTPSSELPVINAVEQIEIFHNDQVFKFKTFEISTDYVKFTSNKKFSIEDNVDGNIKLPQDYGIISFKAIITEIDDVYDNEYTALFNTMSEKCRQSLLYYMYMYAKDSN